MGPLSPFKLKVSTVLERRWKAACVYSWLFFIICELLIGWDRFTNKYPICPHMGTDFKIWYLLGFFSILSGFIITWVIMLGRLFITKTTLQRTSYLIFFNIVSMGMVATFLALFDWGGVCIDVLGVASPASIWGEWCSCGPLLLFAILSPAKKPHLTSMDMALILVFFTCLCCGFLINIPQPIWMGQMWLIISFIFYTPFFFLYWYVKYDNHKMEDNNKRKPANHHDLSLWFSFCMPLFPATYLLAFWRIIDVPQTILVYQFLSMTTKGLYASILMDIHKEALLFAQEELHEERRTNDSRRSFLKYLFHEVRTPLNSLSIGIEILNRSDKLDVIERESLLMMAGASEFMAGTLNDVLSMQKIEEGKMELEFRPFSLSDTVTRVLSTFKGATIAKSLNMVKSIAADVPPRALGDKFKIEHVVGNLLSNSIKFSPHGGTITVSVTVPDDSTSIPEKFSRDKRNSRGSGVQIFTEESEILEIKTVMISVRDEGPGIPKELQGKLFGNFVQIRAGELQNGGGSGLGLSLCKQITQLHGGSVGLESEEGQGSLFYIILPLQVPSEESRLSSPLSVIIPAQPIEDTFESIELSVVTPMLTEHRKTLHDSVNLTVLIVDDVDGREWSAGSERCGAGLEQVPRYLYGQPNASIGWY
mmetsp:Transcript_3773/g.5315  ORF Transcript_3773/g.5315 Transcript_3773/m.5315 type:complete len:648 (+) Transcript_3773:74-2017(+)